MQVTKDNFDSTMPLVTQAVQECAFVAFDCEMTGLFLQGQEHSYIDDMPARYAKVPPLSRLDSALTSRDVVYDQVPSL